MAHNQVLQKNLTMFAVIALFSIDLLSTEDKCDQYNVQCTMGFSMDWMSFLQLNHQSLRLMVESQEGHPAHRNGLDVCLQGHVRKN